MRRLLAALLLVGGLLVAVPPSAQAAVPPAVFFVPHQDDEALSMGVGILEHVDAHRDVRVVVVTDGRSSGARGQLCQRVAICLTPTEFAAARDKEMVAALGRLGVRRQNIYFEGIPDNGSLTLSRAGQVIDKYVAMFGTGASYKTTSWLDANSDHFNLGYALDARCRSGAVRDCRFYQYSVYDLHHPGIVNGTIPKVVTPVGFLATPGPSAYQRVRAAMKEYDVWNPRAGRYAIGWRYSVPASFRYSYSGVTKMRNWCHKPSDSWGSAADARAAAAWVAANQRRG